MEDKHIADTESKLKCAWCEEELIEEQTEDPRHDNTGAVICDDCYSSEYEYACVICTDYSDTEHMGDIGRMLVVTEEIRGSSYPVEPGLYVIVKHPYYADGMIEGYLFNEALESIEDVPERADTEDYPTGHLCEECEEKLRDVLQGGG